MMPSTPTRGRVRDALSAGRRRSGSGHRARRCPFRSSGMGVPRARARCTVRATSSHMTAALRASRGSRPRVKTPWLRISTAGERCAGERVDDPAADLGVADQRERADRDLAAELVGHRGQHARDRLAARGPGRRVGAVRVHDPADVRACRGRRSRAWRRRWTGGSRRRRRRPSKSQTTMCSGVSSSNGDAAGLDDHQVLAGHARGEVAARPRDEPVARQLAVQRADRRAQVASPRTSSLRGRGAARA